MKTNRSLTAIKAIAGVLLFICSFANAQGQTRQFGTVAKLSAYQVKPEYRAQFQQALGAYVHGALTADGNVMAEAYYEQQNPKVIWLIERWTGKKAIESFNKKAPSISMAKLKKRALDKPLKVFYVKDLEPLSKQQWRKTSNKADNQLTVMLFVDAKPGTQDEFKRIYHTAMPQFRSEPGVVTYQLSQLENDATQFVTYEKFRSNDAFQYHLNFPPIKPVIDYLNTSIKKQPFQRGIHNLIEFAPLTR